MNSTLTQWLVRVAPIILVFALVAGCSSSNRTTVPPEADNPNVVAVFAGDVLTLDEFETRYTRSVGSRAAAEQDSLSEYRDFLERYVNFRLKVEAAKEAGIPGSSEVQNEIRNYRANLARPYLLEEEIVQPIVRQLYDRRQEIIDVSHILLRLDPAAAPSDTLAAYRKLEALRDSAAQGVDFGDLAIRHSQDPSATARVDGVGYRGRLGYFTAGRMVEPFETYAFETPEGEVSSIFRTRFGYHILYVHDRREAIPEIRLAHIMLRPPTSGEDSLATLSTMQEIKDRIDGGEPFEELAREYSIDQQTAQRGGDIGFVGFDAPIDPSFRDPAFALDEPGDVSDVVVSPYGFHLIQLIERREQKSFDESYDELKELASRLPRMQAAQQKLAEDILAEHNATIDTAFVQHVFRNVPADSVYARLTRKSLLDDTLAHPAAAIGDSSYTLEDVADFLVATSRERPRGAARDIWSVLDEFLEKEAIEFEASRLEERDEEFARIMEEFRDGLVLFQFMEDSVWTAAERDSSALQAYYDAHQAEYWWPERTRVISVQSRSDSLLTVLGDRLEAGTSLNELYASFEEDTLNSARFDTMMVSEATQSVYDRALDLPAGGHTEPLSYRNGYILLINDGVEESRQKTFDEARTQVVSDYQTIIEGRLIERLHRRYNVHVFPDRLTGAFSASVDGDDAQEMASGE